MNGLHLIGDFYRCACIPALLRDANALERLCVGLCTRAGLTPVGRLFHRFAGPAGDSAGVTGAVILAESHLAIHTWPETASVTLDLYVCNFSGDNRERARAVFAALAEALAPQVQRCEEIARGELPGAFQVA